MRTVRYVLPAGSVLVLLAVLAGCGGADNAPDGEIAVQVRTAPVELREVSPPVHTSGRLSSVLEARLSFKVGGIIRAVHFDEGQSVQRDDVLAVLELDEVEAQTQQARSGFKKAERDYRRAQNLYADSVITLEQLQDARTGLEVARSGLEIAEFNLHHSSIRAPADGRVLRRYAEANELVAPGQPVFLFGATGSEWVLRASVNDRELIRLEIGDTATVKFDAYPDALFEAEVTEISQAADPMSGGYEIELAVEHGEHRLISGFVGDIEIHPSRGGRYRVIPIDALVEADGDFGVVYTIDPETNRARAVEVVIDHITAGKVAVTSGLDDVYRVVTDGAAYLEDSALVNIVP